MPSEFHSVQWDDDLKARCRELVDLALSEDLGKSGDLTTNSLVDDQRRTSAAVVAREAGVVCGLGIAELVRESCDAQFVWEALASDGDPVAPGDRLASIEGPARELLTYERTILNFIGRLSGIASQTRRFVQAVAETEVDVYDTRKTTPGWRLLEKYAVRSGGGRNHRRGLYDAVMIKDNHLAYAHEQGGSLQMVLQRVRQRCVSAVPIEIEVDTLEQLEEVLPCGPDLVLLDNMSCEQLEQAVERRNRIAPEVVLEASGGVTLDTIGAIGRSGVDRISVGALTHSAAALDIGLDWAI